MSARMAGQRVQALHAELSTRDRALLTDLVHLRVLSARQIERLHFREGSALTQARRARRRLQRLTELRVLHRFDRRVGGVRAGSSGFAYALTPLGRRLIGLEDRRRRPTEPSSPFMVHLLAVSELYVLLREAERLGRLELLHFEAEPGAWRASRDGLTSSVLKPDAFIRLGASDYEELAFVEVDLATESRTVIKRKADAYRSYWHTGREQQRFGAFPRVVFLTGGDERALVLTRLLESHMSAELFRVGRLDRALSVLLGEDEGVATK